MASGLLPETGDRVPPLVTEVPFTLPRGYVEVPASEVVGIPFGPRRLHQPFSLLWRAGERLSPAAAAFRDFAQIGSLSSDAHR